MKKIEQFLNSNLYLILITLVGFFTWVLKDDFQQLNEGWYATSYNTNGFNILPI